jgi:hypothetical protein
MLPYEPLRDVMRRTINNLEFVEQSATTTGPFEVTQLINSFIGALAHPWEQLKAELNDMPLSDAAGWPTIRKELPSDADPDSIGELVRLLRNAIAHGNMEFMPGKQGDIKALRIWNKNKSGRRTWGTILTVTNMRLFLLRFVALAEDLCERQIRTKQRSA